MAQGLLRQCDMPDLLYDASQMINTYVSFFLSLFFFLSKTKLGPLCTLHKNKTYQ